LYTFCEKVERDINRINIANLKITDNSGDALTGGYTIEQQNLVQIGPDEVYFEDISGHYFSYKVPESDKVTPHQNNYMYGYWNSFLDKLYNQPLEDTVNGYRSVINPLSFAQYFLLQDLSKNGDAYSNSWYTTKDRLKKMDAGPGWDWNIAWGNLNVQPYYIRLSQPYDTYIPTAVPYYAKMMQDTFFSNLVKNTFAGAGAKISRIIADAEIYYPQLESTGAISRDSARWPNTLVDQNFWNIYPTYLGNINSFLSFVKQRFYYQTRSIYGLMPARPTHADIY